MGWNQMHWEKIPGQFDKEILNRELDEAMREDIPVRLMRVRNKEDGKEYMFYEWFVKATDCVVKGCTSRARKFTTHIVNSKNEYYNLAFCNSHYGLFYLSEGGLDKPMIMKDNVYVKCK